MDSSRRTNLIPVVVQFCSDLSSWTVGVLVITLPDQSAGALFHLGYSKDNDITFDCFYLQLILHKFL
jgi:hypothetical protein